MAVDAAASIGERKPVAQGYPFMPVRLLSAIAALGLLAAGPTAGRSAPAGAAVEAHGAPTDLGAQSRRRAPARIVVVPLRHYYRQCVDWYALEHRPSGDVFTPQMRCRWVAR
jgi:hypothetical protein